MQIQGVKDKKETEAMQKWPRLQDSKRSNKNTEHRLGVMVSICILKMLLFPNIYRYILSVINYWLYFPYVLNKRHYEVQGVYLERKESITIAK